MLTEKGMSSGEHDTRGAALTERPCWLLARPLFQEEPPGGCEDKVALYGCDALELGRERIEYARVEGRAFLDVVRVQLQKLLHIVLRDLGDVVGRNVLT